MGSIQTVAPVGVEPPVQIPLLSAVRGSLKHSNDYSESTLIVVDSARPLRDSEGIFCGKSVGKLVSRH